MSMRLMFVLLGGCFLFAGPSEAGRKRAASPRLHKASPLRDPDASPKARRLRLIKQSALGTPAFDEPLGGPVALEEEKLANRAIPGTDPIAWEATEAAQREASRIIDFNDGDEAHGRRWETIGPTNAVYPQILQAAARGVNSSYVASGRISALGISPRCNAHRCRLYVGAAGGGVWRTDNALGDRQNWKFISGSFASNAIGSITVVSRGDDDDGDDTLFVGTGEPNISGDSGAGMGIYRSDDGGDSWRLLPAVATVAGTTFNNIGKGRSIGAVVVDPRTTRVLYVGLNRGVRGLPSVGGGATSATPGAAPVGLYKSTDGGNTFTQIWDGAGTLRGVNAAALDPTDPDTVYAAAIQSGIWRSSPSDGAGAFQQVFEGQSQLADPNRTEFALTTLPNGHTRIYAGDGAVGAFAGFKAPAVSESQVWRLDNANQPAAKLLADQQAAEHGAAVPGSWKKLTQTINGTPGYATFNYCTGQCWYDNGLFTPAGQPDTIFVIGSYQYNEAGGRSNGRGVVRSTTAGEPDARGVTFTDMTWDATAGPNPIHPDQHALAFAPGNPNIWFEGSDGGLMRSSGAYVDITFQCPTRPIGAASMRTCKRMLSAVPSLLINMNFGLDTIQFQSFSVNPQNPRGEVVGGTQDNGTFQYEGSSVTWNQSLFGDGGQSGFNVANPAIRFATNFNAFVSTNFHAGDPNFWVDIFDSFFDPITGRQLESSAFYIPIITDPVAKKAGSMFAGLQHVWRTTDNGGDQAYLEANCGEVSLPSTPLPCGDWQKIGPQLAFPNAFANPNYVVAVARSTTDTGTLWAATRTGEVFVSHNADAANPAAVTFTRIDTLAPNAPRRFVSGIAIDPANANRAWLSYTGYSARTPTTPGHVFEVTVAGAAATWTSLDDGTLAPLGDVPVNGIARDDATGELYIATDFSVLRRVRGTSHWHLAAPGMPMVEVSGLTLDSSSRLLYAATHGRGGFRLSLSREERADRD